MFEPENRVAFQEIRREIGFGATLRCFASIAFKSLFISYKTGKDVGEIERLKQEHKEHFKLVPLLYKELQKRLGDDKAKDAMRRVIINSGQSFVGGFTPLDPDAKDLANFIRIYKDFEKNNILFTVVEESEKRFEIKITKCLIYEAFRDFGLEDVIPCICDVATTYFNNYHPNISYTKDRMIARGDDTCHETFTWQD